MNKKATIKLQLQTRGHTCLLFPSKYLVLGCAKLFFMVVVLFSSPSALDTGLQTNQPKRVAILIGVEWYFLLVLFWAVPLFKGFCYTYCHIALHKGYIPPMIYTWVVTPFFLLCRDKQRTYNWCSMTRQTFSIFSSPVTL